jgi:hypothetical protein
MANQINSAADGSSLVQAIAGEKVKITAQEWGSKARSKPECYHEVAHTFNAFVPPID